MFSTLSLKYRIAIIIFLLEAVMMSVVLQQTLGQSFDASSKQIANNEQAILELVSGISKSALITEEFAELQPYIEHLKSQTEVSQLFITDADKTIVASSSVSNIGKILPVLEQRENHNWRSIDINNSSGFMGLLAIEFSNKALTSAYKEAQEFGISIALTGMVIIAAFGIIIGFMLTRRLESITVTAQQLADGDFTARTDVTGQDEIGKLAITFNSMIQRLLESKDALSEMLSILQKSEQNLSITLDSIGDAVITTDEKGNVTGMNPVAEKLTGWSLQEARGLSLKIIFPIVDAATRKSIENPVDKVISTGEIIYLSNHTTLISKNGTEYQIADSAAPIRDNDKILGMVLVFNDVTEQYQLRQAAAKSRRDLQSIMDNSPAVIYVKDIEGNFTFINNQFSELFHIKHEEILGKKLHQVFPKEIADAMEGNDKDVLMTGLALESEETAPHDDGLHTYNSVKFPLRDDNNKVYAICGISTDVTERKIKDEQLRRSQKMDALGKLTGGIAHDYNNMLSVILGYTEILSLVVKDQPKIAGYVDEIRHAGERGASLTKKLLTFTRKESSENKVVHLNALLQDSRLMLEKTLTVRIDLIYDLVDDLWPIYLDESDLEDAILNISINAMHAIQDNGKLTFETRNEVLSEVDAEQIQVPAGDYVLLSLTDTGCGMDQETKDKIFDPFFTTKGSNGTGLGLSQVYGLVQRSNGAIKIYSEPKHGTRVTFYLPRYESIEKHTEEKAIESEVNVRGTETILIVDDEPSLTKLVSEILTNQGYSTLVAENGQHALDILDTEAVDLLLSDVIMPEMDGYQLATVVQKKYPSIKIQLASGFSDDRHIEMVDKSLHKEILHKPYHSKTLLIKIRELLD